MRITKYQIFRICTLLGKCDLRNTVVISGTPRSGTTLLLEVLAELPGYKALNEPLLKKDIRDEFGFEIRPCYQPNEDAPLQERFLRETLQGVYPRRSNWMLNGNGEMGSLYGLATRKKLVVKFCRITRMMPWFSSKFNTKRIIFIVRNPYAVVASKLRFGPWSNPEKKTVDDFLGLAINSLPQPVQDALNPIRENVKTRVGILALEWVIDHYVPLVFDGERPWLLVSYEDILLRPEEELRKIGRALDIDIGSEIYERVSKPSSSVKDLAADRSEQLSKWRHRLTADQIESISSVVAHARLSFLYGDGDTPRDGAIAAVQDPRYTLPASSAS